MENNLNSITTEETIKTFEIMLERYEEKLKEDPDSFFYQGLVKNTKEYIEELKEYSKW